MRLSGAYPAAGLTALVMLAACAPETTTGASVARAPQTTVYGGVETLLLDGDLVNFRVAARGDADTTTVADYAQCAAAQYTLIRGYGFARHVRTNVSQEGGIWRADAVYTISPDLPRGLRTLDAEVVVQNCAENGIPTV